MEVKDYSFGRIEIDGKEFCYDIVIDEFSNELRKWIREESHNVFPEDLIEVKNRKPNIVIIGTGNSGQMNVSEKAKDFIKSLDAKLIIEKTPNAIEKYNKEKGKKIGLFHLTC